MKTFLEECALDILEKYDEASSVCVVFPNKRTMIHFRKIYAAQKKQVSFAKSLYPIEKILHTFLPENQGGELFLLAELYKAFREVFYKDELKNRYTAQDFNTFFDTGRRLLADFNEIDNYLVDINQLCHNCADLNELDAFYADLEPKTVEIIRSFWSNFSTEKLSQEKLRFYELWVRLPEVYKIFNNNLDKLNCSYQGRHYRKICQLIDQGNLNTNKFQTYIFVGFNVLNKAERKIFKHLKQAGKAKFYWDSDDYYISDKTQEAGLFMRKNLKDFADELYSKPPQNLISTEKDVEFIGCPLEISQSKVVHNLLEEFAKKPDFQESKTAVVLSDEHLLFPVLSSIPPTIEKINVTMGFPFKETPVFSFLNNYLQLRTDRRQNAQNVDYYFKDVLSIIKHPFVNNLPDFHSKIIENQILTQRKVRISGEYLGSFSTILNLIFFTEISTVEDLLKNILDILSSIYFLKNPDSQNQEKIENEFIYQSYLSVKELYNTITRLSLEDMDEKLVSSLLKQSLTQIKIPLDSQDTFGLQIIGMMETRNIDFDNVIITGMNEGVFPKHAENTSFITESMRLAFDMPIMKYKDAVFGYFFYRLFQRAKNIRVLYNNVFANNLSGEISRFAVQIQKEASKEYNPNSKFSIVERQFLRTVTPKKNSPIIIENKNIVFDKLKTFLVETENSHSLSPSALNCFLSCPLKFYFKYIVRLSPQEELEEETSAADFGSVLHRTMEMLYSEYCNKTVSEADIVNMQPKKEAYALQAYNEHFFTNKKDKTELSGLDSIFFEVLLEYVQRILDYDKKIAPIKILKTEDPVYVNVPFKIDGKTFHARIGGIIDRADYIERTNTLRIADYKTGNVAKHLNFKGIPSLFDSTLKDRSSEGFQVLLYSYVYMQNYRGTLPEPVIYSVREDITSEKSCFTIQIDKTKSKVNALNIKPLTEEFEVHLIETLERLFDKTQKFDPNEGNACRYCDFQTFCNK